MDRIRTGSATLSSRVNDDWRRWIAENLILGSHSDSLVFVLTENGITRQEAIFEIETAARSPYILGANRLRNRLVKHDWVLDIYRKLNRLSPNEVPRRHRLSTEEFLHDYYSVNKPVIITGMMVDWPAMKKWNLDFFKKNFGDREVEVQFGRHTDENYEQNSIAHKRRMKFGEYAELVESSGHTNDF
jgi:hypothetical protein